jgi:putative transposase
MIFSDKRVYREKDREELEAELYRQIGQLKVELEWLKKKSQTLQLRRNGH